MARSVNASRGRGALPRLFAFIGIAAAGVSLAASALAVGDVPPNRELTVNPTFRHNPCIDKKVAPLVGLDRVEALKRVRKMNLLTIRILDQLSVVNYEVYPERLTLVTDANGVIVRAFCR